VRALSGGGRRWPVASSGRARRRTRSRALGHDLKHGEHLRVAREAAKLLEAARAAATQRSDRMTRWCGTGTPARSLGRHGARARQQAAQDGSLPPCADPGWLTTTRQRRWRGFNCGGGNLGFRVPVHEGLAARARVEEVQGRRPAINSPGGFLGVRAMRGDTCLGRTQGRRRRSPGRTRRKVGDDRWAPLVSDSGRGQRRRGMAAVAWASWAVGAAQSWAVGGA
jgi:hypothetical protein